MSRPASRSRALVHTQYLAFVSLGLSMTLTGALLPTLGRAMALDRFRGGLLVGSQFAGMLVTMPLGGHLADRFGKKRFLLVASALCTLGLAGCAAAGSFPVLLLAGVVAGFGTGGYEVGVNALQADHSLSSAEMSLLHFFFGLGAVGGPLLISALAGHGLSWRVPFALAAALPVVVGAVLLRLPVPPGHRVAVHDPAALYRSRLLWAAFALFGLYVATEQAVSGFAASYWDGHGAPFVSPPLLTGAFWVSLTGGRLVCGRLADRLGHLRFVRLASAAAVAAALLWTAFPRPPVAAACVVALGWALAGIFPTAMTLVAAAFPGHSGKVVAFLMVASSLGGLGGPAAVGRAADAFGLSALPALVAALALALHVAARAARPEPVPGATAPGR